jgi:hypothetical protein
MAALICPRVAMVAQRWKNPASRPEQPPEQRGEFRFVHAALKSRGLDVATHSRPIVFTLVLTLP